MWSPRLNLTPAPLALAAMLALGSIPQAQAQTAPTVKLAIAAQPLGQALSTPANDHRNPFFSGKKESPA